MAAPTPETLLTQIDLEGFILGLVFLGVGAFVVSLGIITGVACGMKWFRDKL